MTPSIAGIGLGAFILGMLVGGAIIWRQVQRFHFEADHWNTVVKSKQRLYDDEHQLVKSLRNELVEMHRKVTALTLENVKVLEWVGKGTARQVVSRAEEVETEKEKWSTPSTKPLKD